MISVPLPTLLHLSIGMHTLDGDGENGVGRE